MSGNVGSTRFLSFFILACLLHPFSGCSARTFPIGEMDSAGKLTNDTSGAFKLKLSSFAGYFWKSEDINLGFSVGRATEKPQSISYSLDIAPHRIGPGFTWTPRRGKLRYLSALGAGIGAGIMYNTEIKKFELSIKGVLRRW